MSAGHEGHEGYEAHEGACCSAPVWPSASTPGAGGAAVVSSSFVSFDIFVPFVSRWSHFGRADER